MKQSKVQPSTFHTFLFRARFGASRHARSEQNTLLFLYVDGTKFYSFNLHKIKTNKTTNKAKQQTYPITATSKHRN